MNKQEKARKHPIDEISSLQQRVKELEKSESNLKKIITDNKLTETKLLEADKRWRALLENISDVVFFTDVDGNITYINPTVKKMSGFEQNEVIGQHFSKYIHQDDIPGVTDEFQKTLAGQLKPYEYRIVGKDKRVRYVRSVSYPFFVGKQLIGLTGLMTDITDQRMSDLALKESEKKYRNIVENINDALYIHDFHGNIIDINDNACKMIGYARNELIGKNLSKIVSKVDSKFLSERISQLINENRILFEEQHIKKDGTPVPVEVSAKVISKEGNGVIQGFVRNITRRKQAEKSLEKGNYLLATMNKLAIDLASLPSNADIQKFIVEKLKEMTGAFAVGFSEYDPNSQMLIASHMEVSQGMLEKALQLLGKRFQEVRSPVSAEMYKEIVSMVVGKRKTLTEVTFGAIPPLASTLIQRLLDVDRFIGIGYVVEGELYGTSLLAIKSDMPDPSLELLESFAHMAAISLRRRRVEESLKDSENQYRSVIEAVGAVPYLRDYITNKYEFIGEGIKSLTGYSAEELTPDIWESITQNSIPSGQLLGLTYDEAIVRAKSEGVTNFQLDIIIKTHDGEEKWLSDSSIQIRDEDNNLIKTLGIIQDITDRKQAEAKLYESNRRLEEALAELKSTQHQIIQQERLRALGQLASGIAHDFNNVLTPILGYSDMLVSIPQFVDDKEKVGEYLRVINIAAVDAKGIVGRLREFYRNREEDEAFASIDINQLIQQVIQLTQPKWKDQAQANSISITITTDLQEIPQVNGREIEIREALTNLILNSVDAMPTNGTINLLTQCDEAQVIIEVSDTGIGMTEEVKQKCFEPFFSTKGLGGTGLGLSMVHGIIRRHKGSIEIESETGKGTTFIIRLPISTQIKDMEKAHKEEASSKALHILVVDDEPLIRDMLGEYLLYDGHSFETASNGYEGLEKLQSGNFDLIITDRAMPDMSGDQLAIIAKQSNPDIPIMMITGFGGLMEATNEMPEGIDYLLGKPIALNTFRKALLKVINDMNMDS